MHLVAKNLAAQRGGEILFHHLDFMLQPTQLMTVTGSNGAGKSTLLRIIAGLLEAHEGSICLSDEGVDFNVGVGCHYLGSQNAMKSLLSVEDNLTFWAHFQGDPQLSVRDALKRVELSGLEQLPYGVLSTGQKRRVAIARLLISYRPVWILDEPTSGLDTNATSLFANIMAEHLKTSGMIIAATHLPLGIPETEHILLENYVPDWENMTKWEDEQ